MGAVGMAADYDEPYAGGDERQCEQEAGGEAAHAFEGGHGAGEPEEEAHLAADEAEIDRGQEEDLGPEEGVEIGLALGGFEVGGFGAQRGYDGFALLGWQPLRLAGVVLDGDQPDDQPQEWQRAFGDQHGAPVPMVEDPAGEGRGDDDRAGEAQEPHGVGAGAFGSGEPVGEQDQRGGKDAAFGDTQQEA